MSKKVQRGLKDNTLHTRVDTRSQWDKIKDGLTNKKVALIPSCAAISTFIPDLQAHAALILACTLPIASLALTKEKKVPLRKPYYANRNSKEHDGFFFFGNELETNREIWLDDSEARRHILLFGTTGAGKTESLIGLISNSLAQNSAFVYVDGKADTGLFSKIFSLCRRFGREDDLLVINYMVGTLNATLKRDKKLSNTLNPFATGTAESLSELVTSLLPSGGSSDGIWKDRAASYISALIRPLVALRDDGKLLLDVSVIRSYFQLEKTIELSKRTDIGRDDTAGLRAYVENLPGYQEGKSTIESTVYEQHGFISMQFSPCMGMLSDSYGHIMKTQLADVSMKDVVLQRRPLLVLLPALEKSPQNLANLGKIVISSIKGMMAESLGAELEGKTENIIDSKPTNGRTYQCIFDEFGYYAVEGTSVMPAQARGIGFSLIFCGQDYQAFKKGSEIEAASIRSNCATKICMCLEDATETADIFIDGAGDAYDQVENGLERESGLFGSRYVKKKDVNYEKRKKIDVLDLKDQAAGEFHLLNMAIVIRGKSFYPNPSKPRELRVNTFIPVRPPVYSEVNTIRKGLQELTKAFKDIKKTKSKLTKVWNTTLDDENKELSKNISYLVDKEPMMQVAFALAMRKNSIDLVDQQMVVKLKELEDVVNRKLSGSESFNNEEYFEAVSHEEIKNKARKLTTIEDAKEKLSRKLTENENKILESVDLDNNPLLSFDLDLEFTNDTIHDLSLDILARWKRLGYLDKDTFITNTETQADLAYVSAQELLLSGSDYQELLENEKNHIEEFDFDSIIN